MPLIRPYVRQLWGTYKGAIHILGKEESNLMAKELRACRRELEEMSSFMDRLFDWHSVLVSLFFDSNGQWLRDCHLQMSVSCFKYLCRCQPSPSADHPSRMVLPVNTSLPSVGTASANCMIRVSDMAFTTDQAGVNNRSATIIPLGIALTVLLGQGWPPPYLSRPVASQFCLFSYLGSL